MNNMSNIRSPRTVYDAAIIQFPKILDDRGNLTLCGGRTSCPV